MDFFGILVRLNHDLSERDVLALCPHKNRQVGNCLACELLLLELVSLIMIN